MKKEKGIKAVDIRAIVKSGMALKSKTEDVSFRHDTATILCPVCGYNYTHIESKPIFINGKDGYHAAPSMVRGDVVAIPMSCEDGHKFLMCLGFHKGQTFIWGVEHGGELQ